MRRREFLGKTAAFAALASMPGLAVDRLFGTSADHAADDAAPAATTYICPPCGLPCDKLVFDKPGACPNCGMTLVPTQPGKDSPLQVATLLFNGAQLIDFAGPWEVFGTAGFLVHTVAETKDPITAVFGEKVIPDYTLDQGPRADIVLVPGGGVWNGTIDSPKVLQWLQARSMDARYIMSVCTGAFLLQKAGLLKGQTVVATYGMIEDLIGPETKVVYDRRYVDNGKIITTAGLSARIDGALHLVSKVLGMGPAQSVALNLEYPWDPQGGYARASLADRFLPDGLAYAKPNLKGAKARMVSTDGDRDHWQATILVEQPSTLPEVVELVRERLTQNRAPGGMFKPISHIRGTPRVSGGSAQNPTLKWGFTDDTGRPWNGTCEIKPSGEKSGGFLVTFHLSHKGRNAA